MAERHDAVERLARMSDDEATTYLAAQANEADVVEPDRAAPVQYDYAVTATCRAADKRRAASERACRTADAVLAVCAARDADVTAARKGKRGRPRKVTFVGTARAIMSADWRINPDCDETVGPVVGSVAAALGVSDTSAAKALAAFGVLTDTLSFRRDVIQTLADAAK